MTTLTLSVECQFAGSFPSEMTGSERGREDCNTSRRRARVLTFPHTVLSSSPHSCSLSLSLSCFILRVWLLVRLDWLIEGGHTCEYSFTCSLARISARAQTRQWSPRCQFSTRIQCHIHEVITGTDTHILALSLVEPLNGVPLTAIQSQSLLAKKQIKAVF